MLRDFRSTRFLATAGLIAALYTVLTLCFAPVSFGPVQCRISEALTVTAAFTPAAIPGLAVGCAVSNLLGLSLGAGTAGIADVIAGPLATLAAAVCSWLLRRFRVGTVPLLSTVPPVIFNALTVGTELTLMAPVISGSVWIIQVGLVAAGEAVACVGGGWLLSRLLNLPGVRRYF